MTLVSMTHFHILKDKQHESHTAEKCDHVVNDDESYLLGLLTGDGLTGVFTLEYNRELQFYIIQTYRLNHVMISWNITSSLSCWSWWM